MTTDLSSSDPERDPVDVLADEFAARYRKGETPSITEYVRRYPEHAGQIQSLFPSVALLEQLGLRPDGADRSCGHGQQGRLPPHHRLGDFEILREIGRGGMGVVYEAVQQSLHRAVALKVLNTAAVHSDNQAKRFEREAQAAARLHHTNIVPVFGVGEQDGLRYYVMQRIHGLGLDALLGELGRRTGRHRSPESASAPAGEHSVSAHALVDVLISGELSDSQTGTFTPGRDDSSGRSANVSSPGDSVVTASLPASGPADEKTRLFAITPSNGKTSEDVADCGPPRDIVPSDRVPSDSVPCDPVPCDPVADAEPASRPAVRSSQILQDEITAAQPLDDRDSQTLRSPGNTAPATGGASHSFGRRYWRNIARIGMQVADGLQYAHSQGTLHRDIKPANILLDTDGTAWIADFGLAKVLEADNVTRTGDVVGTLRYMAPEQFHGAASVRSDIYSLGLTLYELLTLRSADGETDRQKLIAHKLTPHDPPSLRKAASDIPRDLDTIVLKCLAYEAKDRYATAGDVVADLQAFLDDRPIQARQSFPVERLWRWCRRNPAVATLSGTVALLLLVTVGLTSAGYVQEKQRATEERRLRSDAVASQQKAEASREKAEDIVRIAFEAFDDIGQLFVSNDVIGTIALDDEDSDEQLQVAAFSPETAAIMEQLRSSFDKLAKVAGEDRRFLDYAAKADLRAGELHLRLSQWGQAEAAFSRAIRLYEQLEEEQQDPETRLRLAKLYNGLGVALVSPRDWERKREAQRTALSLLRDEIDRPEMQFELARTHYLMGRRSFGRGPGESPPPRDDRRGPPVPDGRRGPPPSITDRPGPPGQQPPLRDQPVGEELRDRRDDGRSYRRGGRRPDGARRDSENRDHLEKAAALFTDLVAKHPSVSLYQYWLALCYLETAKQSLYSAEAITGRTQAITILETLVDEHPEQADYLYQLSEAYALSDARLRGASGHGPHRIPEGAAPETISGVEHDLREALRVSDELIKRQPHVPGYAMSNFMLLVRLADVKRVQKEYRDALELFDRAQQARATFAERFPEMRSIGGRPGSSLDFMQQFVHAHLLVAEGRIADARAILQPLVDRFENNEVTEPRGRRHRLPREILAVYRLLETCYNELGEGERADDVRAKLEAMNREEDARGGRLAPRRPPPEL